MQNILNVARLLSLNCPLAQAIDLFHHTVSPRERVGSRLLIVTSWTPFTFRTVADRDRGREGGRGLGGEGESK